VAVFPDHTVLKNTTDEDAAARAALAAGQPAGLYPGELCVRRFSGGASIYTLDSLNDVVEISGGGGGGGGSGRGDGGDFDTGEADGFYVHALLGGGDFDTGDIDIPTDYDGGYDGGELT
jgi:hypothetical protein